MLTITDSSDTVTPERNWLTWVGWGNVTSVAPLSFSGLFFSEGW